MRLWLADPSTARQEAPDKHPRECARDATRSSLAVQRVRTEAWRAGDAAPPRPWVRGCGGSHCGTDLFMQTAPLPALLPSLLRPRGCAAGLLFDGGKKSVGRTGDFVNCSLERRLVRPRGCRKPAQLPDELHSRGADLLVGCGRGEIEQGSDVPARRTSSAMLATVSKTLLSCGGSSPFVSSGQHPSRVMVLSVIGVCRRMMVSGALAS